MTMAVSTSRANHSYHEPGGTEGVERERDKQTRIPLPLPRACP
jgi:hypothetical protein